MLLIVYICFTQNNCNMRITFKLDNTLQVFRLGGTRNEKISPNKNIKIVQTYTFAQDQFNYVKDSLDKGVKTDFKTFFGMDAQNCFDCPFSSNAGNGKCYTHKFTQYSGFISMIRSIVKEFGSIDNIPEYNGAIASDIVKMSTGKYVRFGTYGEPTIHPFQLVKVMAETSKSYTGYTHQYARNPLFADYLMASTHNQLQAKTAKEKFGYRSFIAMKSDNDMQGVVCPASKENNYTANCHDCGLCSGVTGKSSKDILILEH